MVFLHNNGGALTILVYAMNYIKGKQYRLKGKPGGDILSNYGKTSHSITKLIDYCI